MLAVMEKMVAAVGRGVPEQEKGEGVKLFPGQSPVKPNYLGSLPQVSGFGKGGEGILRRGKLSREGSDW
jgi:hypothetical protein